jgi:hypothetical protein
MVSRRVLVEFLGSFTHKIKTKNRTAI